jgi:hypothetical protein
MLYNEDVIVDVTPQSKVNKHVSSGFVPGFANPANSSMKQRLNFFGTSITSSNCVHHGRQGPYSSLQS